jgi:hypothetical protein
MATQMVHVRVDGRSHEISDYGLLDIPVAASDARLKQAAAAYLDMPADKLAAHVVVREQTAIIVRPEAVYG